MNRRVIPLADQRYLNTPPLIPSDLESPSGLLSDTLGQPLHDLRISVTDRCNFRCVYCMPKDVFDKDYSFLPETSLLSFEEITRIAKIFIAHGVEKIRLTGGEPLLRKNVEHLIEMLATLRTPDGRAIDLTLTTNGSLLAKKARALKDAGLKRVTVSLDSLDDATFKRMNDVDFPVSDVLSGIEAAHQAGLGPIKINMVVKRGINEQEIVPMARHFKGSPTAVAGNPRSPAQGPRPDSFEVVVVRIAAAREEIAHVAEYDYVMINEEFNRAVLDLRSIVRAGERLKLARQISRHGDLINRMK